jgi:ATP-binding cassette subfamily B protein
VKTNFSRIFFYLKPHIKKHWLSCLLVFAGYGLGIVFDSLLKPYLYKTIVDTLTSGVATPVIIASLTHLAILLAFVILFQNIGYRFGDFANAIFQSKIMKEMHDSSFRRILAHSYHFFSNNFSGSLVAKAKRFTKSFETLADVVTYPLYFSIFTTAGIVVVLFFKAPLLAWIFLVWTLIYVAITFLFIRKKISYDTDEAEADSNVTAHLADAILNVINIKIFSASKKEEQTFDDVTDDEERKRLKAWQYANFQNSVQAVLMGILQVVVLFASINLWSRNLLSVGMIVLLQFYMFNLFDILWNLGKSLTKAIKALTDMKEVVDIFDLPIDIRDPENPATLHVHEGKIAFENVSFQYKGGIGVFENFNLTIASGERIGIVGHSGAGKSTITKLLLRFADVTEGSIRIDDQDIRSLAQEDLRSLIAYVPQESILFHRTIKENISYARPDATDQEIEEVARKAHADEFISRLPSKYGTLVGERGVKLSGGERQRVAIARALLKNSPILVLDEATSSLDSISESYIQDAFKELMKDKTTIVIAHRLSTIAKMDRIIVLENGSIVETGKHEELLKQKGVYANLWNHQSGGFIQ